MVWAFTSVWGGNGEWGREVSRRRAVSKRVGRVVVCSGEGSNAEDPTANWRDFRARLIAREKEGRDLVEDVKESSSLPKRWAHEVSSLERGCILVASPKFFPAGQEYFAETVIFVLEHGADGTCGVVLNRPLTDRLSNVEFNGTSVEDTKMLGESFRESALYLGGPVGLDKLIILHDCPGVENTTEVVKGIYCGGMNGLVDRCKKRTLDPNRIRFFCGYAGWDVNQLEEEIKQGVWFVAASSNEIVTDQCIQLPRPLWRQVLDLMGGKYSDISSKYDELDGGKFKI